MRRKLHAGRHQTTKVFPRSHGVTSVSAMASMGYSTFSIMGHDRGARVAYRMARRSPHNVGGVVIIEIIPTRKAFNAEMAMKAYHWSFLAQPFPLPETLIAGDPIFYLEWTLRSCTKGHHLDAFDSRILGKLSRANTRPCTRARNVRRLPRRRYHRQAARSLRQNARCEDNRAAPFRLVEIGIPSNAARDPLNLWKAWTQNLSGAEVDCGHFMPEENPEALLAEAVPFLSAAL